MSTLSGELSMDVPGDSPAVLRGTLDQLRKPLLLGLAFIGGAAVVVEVIGSAVRRRP